MPGPTRARTDLLRWQGRRGRRVQDHDIHERHGGRDAAKACSSWGYTLRDRLAVGRVHCSGNQLEEQSDHVACHGHR